MDGKKSAVAVLHLAKNQQTIKQRVYRRVCHFSAFCGRTKTIAQVETHKISALTKAAQKDYDLYI